MKRHRHSLFLDGLSDESAAAISEFLHQLAAACEARYPVQLRRHRSRQMNLYDPQASWKIPPGEPF